MEWVFGAALGAGRGGEPVLRRLKAGTSLGQIAQSLTHFDRDGQWPALPWSAGTETAVTQKGSPARKRPETEMFYRIVTNQMLRNREMKWSTPAFEDLRLGFEINLYINNR